MTTHERCMQNIKEDLVRNEIDYVEQMVMGNKHDELYDYILNYHFNNFKSMSDEEIKEQHEWRFNT